jgi:two-component system cell cycle sensor histidine kinase/response regulator CckA
MKQGENKMEELTRIFIVEDEGIVAFDIKQLLLNLGYDVVGVVSTGEEAIEKVEEIPIDLILMDISLEGEMDGIEAAKRIQGRWDVPIIYLTAHSDKKTLERAKVTDPLGYIVKPFDKPTLHTSIEMAIYKHRMKKQLEEKDETFRNLVENAVDGILIAVVDGSQVYANQRAIESTGYTPSQLLDICLPGLTAANESCRDQENRLDDTFFPKRRVITINREDKGTVTLEMTGTKTILHGQPAVLMMLHDVTQLKQAEGERDRLLAQREHARKMEAIGTLANGVAHHINNLLMIILGFTELAMSELPRESRTYSQLKKVIQGGLRARDVVQQILTFSNPDMKDRQPVRIGPIIAESLRLLWSSVPSTIDIRENITAKSDVVLADPSQINQVLINLCNNAIDAMKEQGGILEVILEEVELDEAAAMPDPGLEPGHFLKLTVADTGHGMTPEVMKRVFEPFFTTGAVGECTGMGLAVVHGIVKNHGGAVTVQSEPGKGSIFQVYLPKSGKKVKRGREVTGYRPGRHERILFVDDEKLMVETVEKMLVRLGYRVTAKTSSVDALELFKREADRFDMVITDLIMPGMTGLEMAKEILKFKPGIPLMIFTGFSERIDEKEAKAIGIDAVLKKPLLMRELEQKIRNVLDKDR